MSTSRTESGHSPRVSQNEFDSCPEALGGSRPYKKREAGRHLLTLKDLDISRLPSGLAGTRLLRSLSSYHFPELASSVVASFSILQEARG